MNIIILILQAVGVIFLFFAAFGLFPPLANPPRRRPNWGWLGLALIFLSFMLGGLEVHQMSGLPH